MTSPFLLLTFPSVDVDFDLLYFFLYFLVTLSGPIEYPVRPYGKAIDRCTHSPARLCRASTLVACGLSSSASPRATVFLLWPVRSLSL